MHNIEVRKATPSDLEALADLFNQYRQFYAQPDNLVSAKTFLSERMHKQESIIFVALSNNSLVGFCQLYPTFCSVIAAPIAVLYDLFVHPSIRKSGAGRALMLNAQMYAQQQGFARLDLSTAKTNFNAQALYESLGWKRDAAFYYYSLAI